MPMPTAAPVPWLLPPVVAPVFNENDGGTNVVFFFLILIKKKKRDRETGTTRSPGSQFLARRSGTPASGSPPRLIAICPGYISRSVVGSYDNEGVMISTLLLTFYLFVKAVAGVRVRGVLLHGFGMDQCLQACSR